ncbi:MAG: potassium-transporting ATPase subunit KdpC [Alphaproteobacteria bacterium]|nr:potassium-transporting ATPase subunit KdpC [Alphaproteobacteria bacterium]
MLQHLRASIVLLALFTVLTGLIYPLALAGIGQGLLKRQAEGSPIVRNGVVVGSSLIGQAFTKPEYFWGRPSAAGKGYDARSSSGSNLGPSSKVLVDRITDTAKRFGQPAGEIPPDLLMASASGLDPHISPAGARFQVKRVAAARGLSEQAVARVVDEHVETPSLGVLGEPRVNVLELNIALDALSRKPSQ